MYIPQSVQTEYSFHVVFAPVCQWLICLCFWERIFSNSFTKSTSIRRVDFSWVVFTWKKPAFLPGMARLSYLYTLRLIGPISYPGECDLMVHPRKHIVIFSRVTNAFCYLFTYITCTKIRDRPD